jgi:hypothetical protein
MKTTSTDDNGDIIMCTKVFVPLAGGNNGV